MLAEVVDAVVGSDTHRDTHALEMVTPNGVTVATTEISNTEAGFTEALAWITDHKPGAQVAVAVEGTRSYGLGLTRALHAAGLTVVEIEQPRRSERRRGKTDSLDAHLAAVHALRLDATQLPTPRADGDREALRILLGARHELATTRTSQINRMRALLLAGDDSDRSLARSTLTAATLNTIADRDYQPSETREHTVRHGEIRRLARAIRNAEKELADNKNQLSTVVSELAPALLEATGVGPVSAAQAIVSWSHPGRCRNDAAFAALAGASPCRPVADASPATDSTAVATGLSTAPYTTSRSPAGAAAHAPRPTSPNTAPTEVATPKSAESSNATSHANSTEPSTPLDTHSASVCQVIMAGGDCCSLMSRR